MTDPETVITRGEPMLALRRRRMAAAHPFLRGGFRPFFFGGLLGQVGRCDTSPELDRALATMNEGSVAPAPMATRHGYHILRLDRRAPGRQLPLERVSGWIEDHLRKTPRRRVIAQYLPLLAGTAKISGFDVAGADSPQ